MKFKSKFPFPQMLDGRRVTTEIDRGKFRAIVWCKESDGIGTDMVYSVYECSDLWQLREIAQYYEPKHNPKSLCY